MEVGVGIICSVTSKSSPLSFLGAFVVIVVWPVVLPVGVVWAKDGRKW